MSQVAPFPCPVEDVCSSEVFVHMVPFPIMVIEEEGICHCLINSLENVLCSPVSQSNIGLLAMKAPFRAQENENNGCHHRRALSLSIPVH